MRGWIAGGGRLIIVGGTAGPSSLSAFSDDILPYRPEATTDVAPASLQGLLGELPDDAADLPALAGDPWRADEPWPSAATGSIAAERAYGSGAVTIVGFDPTIGWIAEIVRRRGPVAPAPAGTLERRPGRRRRQPDRVRGLASCRPWRCRRSAA